MVSRQKGHKSIPIINFETPNEFFVASMMVLKSPVPK